MTRTPTPHADIREEFARIAETVKPPASRTWTWVAISAFNVGKEYAAAAIRAARAPVPDVGHPHLIDGEFQSDKYPTTPRNKVPLSTKDKTAQDLLWEYAQRRRAVDAEFATDLEIALTRHGYNAPNRSHPLPSVCGGEDAREALWSCESTLQLCSERIASDRVAMDQIATAIQKENASPNFKKAMAGQDKIDKYVFAVIDQSRALAQGVLASHPPVSAGEESIRNAIAAMEGVHEANMDMCFCADTKGRGLGQCVWCDLRSSLAALKREVAG